jgi:leucyl-tRNA synthetase
MEKKGKPLGIDVLHPLTGERVPVWVANFVLMSYGTGAVMAVPAHDQRDFEFATRYGLPIRQAIAPADGSAIDLGRGAYTDYGVLVDSGQWTGLDFAAAFDALAAYFESRGEGRRRVNYRLRDWGVSRQRYWGCPIPIVHCPDCGAVPVPEDELPVELPEDVRFMGVQSPIKADPTWRRTRCPQCGGEAERDTDTFDTFVESSWYYARYCSPGADAIVDERADYWLPIDQYVGGIEHAVMHLLYFRFWHKLMRDEGLVASDEPARQLLCQGMVLAESYYRDTEEGGREWIPPAEVDVTRGPQGQIESAVWREDGGPVVPAGWTTMSKSKNNGVDPNALVERYGADTVRLFVMFAAPPDQALEWSDEGVQGASRFLRRLWRTVSAHVAGGPAPALDANSLDDDQRALRRQAHQTLAKVGDDIGRRYTFNTAIAAVMELLNAVGRFEDDSPEGRAVVQEALELAVLMLSPMVPHVAHELWQSLGHDSAPVNVGWPAVDPSALVEESIEIVVQVNGKLRGRVRVPADADREAIEREALADANVRRFVGDQAPRKVIVVPGKLVNVVV